MGSVLILLTGFIISYQKCKSKLQVKTVCYSNISQISKFHNPDYLVHLEAESFGENICSRVGYCQSLSKTELSLVKRQKFSKMV